MKFNHVLLIWLSTLFATTQANKYAGGHTLLFMYYAYKIDIMTLGPDEDSRICPELRAARGDTEMPYFDEFVKHIFPKGKWGIYNSKGLGKTVDPSPDLGWRQLCVGFPESWLKENIPGQMRLDRLVPNLDQTQYPQGTQPQLKDILEVLTNEVQYARSRAPKDGVNVKDMLAVMKKCGDNAIETRVRDIHDFKIADFNRLFGGFFTAAVRPKTMSDGTVVQEFDRDATAAKGNAVQHASVLNWSDQYGTDAAYDDNKDAWVAAKRHETALQATTNAVRRISRSRLCIW